MVRVTDLEVEISLVLKSIQCEVKRCITGRWSELVCLLMLVLGTFWRLL